MLEDKAQGGTVRSGGSTHVIIARKTKEKDRMSFSVQLSLEGAGFKVGGVGFKYLKRGLPIKICKSAQHEYPTDKGASHCTLSKIFSFFFSF